MTRRIAFISLVVSLVILAGCGQKSEDLSRVLILAIEGADLEYVEPMIEQGRLPHMARLFKEGVHGTLYSTIPPLTPSTWTTLTTGKTPGQTGVYQWVVLAKGTYRGSPVTGAAVGFEKRIWDLVSDAGGRVIVVNVPFTFPPSKVNGVLICGLPADENGAFAYPPDLAEQLRQKGYVPHFKNQRTIEEYLAAMNERGEMATRYMRRLDWDLCMVALKNLDEVCHFYIEDTEAIQTVYEQADRVLGKLVETAGPETSIMVLSDHGYFPGAYDRYFSINRWLLEEGYLSLRGELDDSLRVVPFDPESPPSLGLGRYQILWPASAAFSIADCHSNFGHIQINLRGREPTGIVEPGQEYLRLIQDIKRGLLSYRDPDTGDQIVKHVFTRDEIYSGERVEDLPDIFFQTARGVLPLGVTISGVFELSQVVGPLEIGRNHPYPGNAEWEGMIAMAGPHFRMDQRLDTELANVAPTLLYMLGLPVPPDFAGSVVEGAFTQEYLADHPVRFTKTAARKKGEPEFVTAPDPSDSRAKEIMNTLGYLR